MFVFLIQTLTFCIKIVREGEDKIYTTLNSSFFMYEFKCVLIVNIPLQGTIYRYNFTIVWSIWTRWQKFKGNFLVFLCIIFYVIFFFIFIFNTTNIGGFLVSLRDLKRNGYVYLVFFYSFINQIEETSRIEILFPRSHRFL